MWSLWLGISWLDIDKVEQRLTKVGHFLLAYELLLAAIVDGVRDFYLVGLKDGELVYSDDYKTEVLSKAKHVFEASLIWLEEKGVIEKSEVDDMMKIRQLRNQVAHGVPRYVFEEDEPFDDEVMRKIRGYVRKIDRYWGQIAVETDWDLLEKSEDIDFEGIVSLRSLALDHITLALGLKPK